MIRRIIAIAAIITASTAFAQGTLPDFTVMNETNCLVELHFTMNSSCGGSSGLNSGPWYVPGYTTMVLTLPSGYIIDMYKVLCNGLNAIWYCNMPCCGGGPGFPANTMAQCGNDCNPLEVQGDGETGCRVYCVSW